MSDQELDALTVSDYGGMVRLLIRTSDKHCRALYLTQEEWRILNSGTGASMESPVEVHWCEPPGKDGAENGHVRSLEPAFANKAEAPK